MKASNTLLMMGSRLMGQKLKGTDFSPNPLNTGVTDATSLLEENIDFNRQRLHVLMNMGQFRRAHRENYSIIVTWSGPVAFDAS